MQKDLVTWLLECLSLTFGRVTAAFAVAGYLCYGGLEYESFLLVSRHEQDKEVSIEHHWSGLSKLALP